MSMEELSVEHKTVAVIAEVAGRSVEDFALVDDLVEGVGLDSLDIVEMVMQIEEAFDIEIPDEAAEKWKTVADVVAYTAGLGIQ